MSTRLIPRVVFDTDVVLSALLFPAGRPAWLRAHWRECGALSLISPATAQELSRVLAYAKFGLTEQYRMELLAMYIPYCESVEPARKCPVRCRDLKDQPLLDLAHGGDADFLVKGDEDLLALAGVTLFEIVSPAPYFEIIASTPKESARAPPLRLSLLYQRLQAAIPYLPPTTASCSAVAGYPAPTLYSSAHSGLFLRAPTCRTPTKPPASLRPGRR